MGIYVVAGLGAVIFWADRMGWLPSKKSPADAAADLLMADRRAAGLQVRLDAALERQKLLERERSNDPVLEVLAEISRQLQESAKAQDQNAKAQAQVIDRLAKHNGSFSHMEHSLSEVSNGLRLLTGFITSVADIPMKEKP